MLLKSLDLYFILKFIPIFCYIDKIKNPSRGISKITLVLSLKTGQLIRSVKHCVDRQTNNTTSVFIDSGNLKISEFIILPVLNINYKMSNYN